MVTRHDSIRMAAFFVIFVCLAFPSPDCAQGQQQNQQQKLPVVVSPSDPALDAMLAAQDWKGLGEALNNPKDSATFTKNMDWLHAKVAAGEGYLLSFMYMKYLWTVGNSSNTSDPGHDMRMTAGFMALYNYELIVIDGAKCADPSAAGTRLDQLFLHGRDVFSFLKKQTPEWKAKLVEIAIAYEKNTAPRRKEDMYLCGGGLDAIRAGLEHGQQQQVPTQPGHIGTTVAVEPPADWSPKFLTPDIYTPMQDRARAGMRERLLKLME